MKHVWILNHYAQGPDGSGGTRHFALARHLPENGWTATIIAASTNHNLGTQSLADGIGKNSQLIDGVRFLRLRAHGYSGNGAARIRNMLDYTFAVLQRRNLQDLDPPDAIVGSSVHPLAAWAGSVLARRYRVPFVFEVRDLWPQTLIDMGRLKPTSMLAVILRALEKRLYRDAKKIVVLLPRAGDYIERLGISADKVVWISNGVDLPGTEPELLPDEPRTEFKLMYFGAHGQANALHTVLEAMKLVATREPSPPVRLHLIGDGPEKERLKSRAAELALDNVVFHPPVPKAEIPQLARSADAFVLSVRDLPNLYRYGISMNKLFDYMAAGRPVVLASGAFNNPVADAGAGVTVLPENPEKLAEAISALARLPQTDRLRMGAAGYAHVAEHYSFSKLATRFARTLDGCCNERS